MEMWDIDAQLVSYLRNKGYDQAEQFLLEQYTEIKGGGNATALSHILGALAHFYCLPFKKNLSRAELYYREMESNFPGRETDLTIAMFYFYNLRDFTKTIERVQAMGVLERQEKRDIQFYYSALTLKGQALLHLGRDREAVAVLQELAQIIARSPKQVPYGDEFNFLNEMTERRHEPELCKQLATVIVSRIRDQEFKNKFMAMLKQLEN